VSGTEVGRSSRLGIVLAGGAAPSRADLDDAWPGWDAGTAFVVAADGGARHAAPLGLRVHRWVGDGDSIDPALLDELATAGVAIERVAAEKDASDAELAVLAAMAAGVDEVALIGGLGGPRVDHALANVVLLGHPALAGRTLRLYDEHAARISLLVAPDAVAPGAVGGEVVGDFVGRIGDLVSLVPIGDSAIGVTTDGLRYPLVGEPLELGRTRGVSNVRTATRARVTLEAGRLLVIETPANLRP
jgi:thiamine pyrophosphokinase